MKRQVVLRFFALFSVFSNLPGQIRVDWASEPEQPGNPVVNRQSDGVTPLNGDFEFLLGSFTGIVPGPGNLGEWEAAFQSFGTAVYSEEFKSFQGAGTLTSNAPPFTTNTRVYIWGRNGTGPGSEWFLFGNPGWTWPQAVFGGGPPPFPGLYLINRDSVGDAIFGTLNQGGILMQTAVADFDLTYEQWEASVFEEGDPAGRDQDFDADGRPNFLEYALGSDPKTFDEPFRVALERNLEIGFARARGRQVDWQLQGSDDLGEFTTLTEGFAVSLEDPERVVFSIAPMAGGRRFFRVLAVDPE